MPPTNLSPSWDTLAFLRYDARFNKQQGCTYPHGSSPPLQNNEKHRQQRSGDDRCDVRETTKHRGQNSNKSHCVLSFTPWGGHAEETPGTDRWDWASSSKPLGWMVLRLSPAAEELFIALVVLEVWIGIDSLQHGACSGG